jgi:hypothetical protein
MDFPPIPPGQRPALAGMWLAVFQNSLTTLGATLIALAAIFVVWKSAIEPDSRFSSCVIVYNAGVRFVGADQPSYEILGRSRGMRADVTIGSYKTRDDALIALAAAPECRP